MKLAIFSDVHANPCALQKVLEDAKEKGCQKFVCLGDVVGYGYDPCKCIDILKQYDVSTIKGNHDAGVVGELDLSWFSETATYGIQRNLQQIDESRLAWLKTLELQIKPLSVDGFRLACSHGSLRNPSEFNYIFSASYALPEFELMQKERIDVLFVGHTHYAEAYSTHKDNASNFLIFNVCDQTDRTIPIDKHSRMIVNVGSVGYPRNQPFSTYCIFDSQARIIEYHVLAFDFLNYIKELQSRNIRIPSWLNSRLTTPIN